MALADLLVKINGDVAGLKSALGDANAQLAAFGRRQEDAAKSAAAAALRQASIFEGSLRGFSQVATRAGSQLTLGFSLPLAAVGVGALKAAGEMEQSNIAFTTMLGSATKAKAMLGDLADFALKTPFEFRDLQDASKRLIALGFAANDVIPTLTSVGDAVAGLGGGKETIDRITLALGQMKAKGTIQAEEMRQLAEAGIPAWEILAKTLKVDIPTAMKMVEQRTVQSAKAIPAILAGMNERFSGLMEMQSRTLLGQWSNVKDKLYLTVAEIGKNLMPLGKTALENLDPALTKVKELTAEFSRLPDSTKNAALGITGIAVATPAAVWGLGQVSGTLANIIGFAKSGSVGLWGTVVQGAILNIGLAAASGYVSLKQFQKGLDELKGKYPEMDQAVSSIQKRMQLKGVPAVEAHIRNKVASETAAILEAIEAPIRALEDARKTLGLASVPKELDEISAAYFRLAKAGQMTSSQMGDAFGKIVKAADPLLDSGRAEISRLTESLALSGINARAASESFAELPPPVELTSQAIKEFTALPLIQRLQEQSEASAKAAMDAGLLRWAYTTLNLESSDNLAELADNAQAAFKLIESSGTASMERITRAFIASERAQIVAAEAKGVAVAQSWKDLINKIEDSLPRVAKASDAATKHVESGLSRLSREISTIKTDLSRDIADLAVDGGKLKDVLVGVAESFGKALLRATIEAQLDRISKLFKGLISEGSALGKVLGTIFGTSGSSGSASSGAAGAVSAGIQSGTSGAAGGASSGLSGVLSTVFSGISAATGVIGVFQNAKQETTLNAIEWNTRKSSIISEYMINDYISKYMPKLGDLMMFNWDVQARYLQLICANVETIAAKSAPTGNANFYIYNANDPKKVAEQVIAALRLNSTAAAYA